MVYISTGSTRTFEVPGSGLMNPFGVLFFICDRLMSEVP